MADGSIYTECKACYGRGVVGRLNDKYCHTCGGTGRCKNTPRSQLMKVAVVGMYDRQVQHVRAEEFKNLDIRFANKGSKYGLSERAVFDNADRVLVMTKFVSHSLTDGLDKSKTTFIDGGFGKLRSVLENLNATARIQDREQPEAKPPRQREQLPPPVQQEEDNDMSERQDFTALKDAKVGDVLVFHRPPKMTLDRWTTKIQLIRSYYKRNYGIISESEHKDGEARILVTKIVKDKEKSIKSIKSTKSTKPADTPAVSIVTNPPPTQLFWQDVFLQAMRNNPGGGHAEHAATADTAVKALESRFRK